MGLTFLQSSMVICIERFKIFHILGPGNFASRIDARNINTYRNT